MSILSRIVMYPGPPEILVLALLLQGCWAGHLLQFCCGHCCLQYDHQWHTLKGAIPTLFLVSPLKTPVADCRKPRRTSRPRSRLSWQGRVYPNLCYVRLIANLHFEY